MKNVLFVKGESQYDAMRNYIDEIEIGFRLAGYNTNVLDACETSFGLQLQELLNSIKLDMTFVCNAILTISLPGTCYLTYLTDHPAAHIGRLKNLGDEACVFVCDRRHEDYIRRYCPNIKHVKYIPLAGEVSNTYVPYNHRSKEIVFTGSYSRPETIYGNMFGCDAKARELVKYTADLILSNPEKDLETGLRESLSFFGIDVPDQTFHAMLFELMDIDAYARSYYRDQVIRTLVESGLQVYVYGNGWENFEGNGKENLIIEKGNFYVARKAVADAKISLNVMPWFKDGFQERIAAAMLSGTVAVTDESAYICENFTDGKEMVLYSLKHLEELPEKIKWLLAHPEEAEKIANTGKMRAEREMTWQHRAFEMIHYMQECFSMPVPQKGTRGEVLPILYRVLHDRGMIKDAVRNMDKIIDMISQVRMYDKVELQDIEFFYTRFLLEFVKINANIPEVSFSEFLNRKISDLREEQADDGAELLILECVRIQAILLSMENQELGKEKALLQTQISEAEAKKLEHSMRVLIAKMRSNYGESEDQDIQEILRNIEATRYVSAYNQDFTKKYHGGMQGLWDLVKYDPEAGMPYALWNGKKMYYPAGYPKEGVATSLNFTSLEQDPRSPHRYLDDAFNVREGDIVVDAGVAEGNFALDVVERAKKVYLVECEHQWIAALRKTFEPWQDKVVIVEKMLGDTENEQCTTLDTVIKEGYVNFLKLDVEGAEIPSLKGASKILENSRNIKCAVCAYHRKNAEKDIREILEGHGFYTSTTKGYMFFSEDMDSWIDGELRHGIVRAVKSK